MSHIRPGDPRRPLSGFAFLVLAHDNAEQLAMLLRWLDAAGASLFLHLDRRAGGLRQALAQQALPAGLVVLPEADSERIAWGGYAMVQATLRLLRLALRQPATRHVCLLSGSHLPLQPPAAIAGFLGDGRQHIDLRFAALEAPERESLRRFWYQGLAGREQQRPLLRWLNQQSWRLGKRDLAQALHGMTPMVGSQWWHMTAPCARHLLQFLDANPWYQGFFRRARIPDESFFQTLLGASPFAAMVGEAPSWQSMQGFSPALMTEAELPAARASGRPFGRKFDLQRTPELVQGLLAAVTPEPPVSWTAAADMHSTPSLPAARAIGRSDGLPDGMRPLGRPPAPQPGEVIALLVTRNEELRLPSCLRALRRQGVHRAIVIDNGSSDGTRAILARQDWVHLIDAPGSYAQSNFGVHWTNAVLDRYARDHWVLVVDADEQLVFPGGDAAGLPALCTHLDSIGSEALRTVMLDCFPDQPLNRLACSSGDDLLSVAPWFEPPSLRFEPCGDFPGQQAYGGLRERLFFPEADPRRLARRLHQRAFNLGWRLPPLRAAGWYRRLAPRRSPNLMKVPLIRWRRGAALLSSTHLLAPMRLAPEQPSGVLLHFKFLQDFHARAADAVARGAHYDGSREYRRYLAALQADAGFSLHGRDSRRFEGADQLVSLGLMRDSTAWAAARAAAQAHALT